MSAGKFTEAEEPLVAGYEGLVRAGWLPEPSAGSVGDIATFALPKNWGVQFSVTRHSFADGTEYAGLGVKPDLLVIPTVDDLLAGNQPMLDRARGYLKGGRGR